MAKDASSSDSSSSLHTLGTNATTDSTLPTSRGPESEHSKSNSMLSPSLLSSPIEDTFSAEIIFTRLNDVLIEAFPNTKLDTRGEISQISEPVVDGQLSRPVSSRYSGSQHSLQDSYYGGDVIDSVDYLQEIQDVRIDQDFEQAPLGMSDSTGERSVHSSTDYSSTDAGKGQFFSLTNIPSMLYSSEQEDEDNTNKISALLGKRIRRQYGPNKENWPPPMFGDAESFDDSIYTAEAFNDALRESISYDQNLGSIDLASSPVVHHNYNDDIATSTQWTDSASNYTSTLGSGHDDQEGKSLIEQEVSFEYKKNLMALVESVVALQIFLRHENTNLQSDILIAASNYSAVAKVKFGLTVRPSKNEGITESFYSNPPEKLRADPDAMLFKHVLDTLLKEKYGLEQRDEILEGCKNYIWATAYSNPGMANEFNNLMQGTTKRAQAICDISSENNPLLSETMWEYLNVNKEIGSMFPYQISLLDYESKLSGVKIGVEVMLRSLKKEKEQNIGLQPFYEALELQLNAHKNILELKLYQVALFKEHAKTKTDFLWKSRMEKEGIENQSNLPEPQPRFGLIKPFKRFRLKDKRKTRTEAKVDEKAEREKKILQAGKEIIDKARDPVEKEATLNRSSSIASFSSVYSADVRQENNAWEATGEPKAIKATEAALYLLDNQLKQQRERLAIAQKQLNQGQNSTQKFPSLSSIFLKHDQKRNVIEEQLKKEISIHQNQLEQLEKYKVSLEAHLEELLQKSKELARKNAILKERMNRESSINSIPTAPAQLCLPMALKSLIADDMEQYPDLIEGKEEKERYLQVLEKIKADLTISARWTEEKFIEAKQYSAEHYETVYPGREDLEEREKIKVVSLSHARLEQQLLAHMEDLHADLARVVTLISRVGQQELLTADSSLQKNYAMAFEGKENKVDNKKQKTRMEQVFKERLEASRNRDATLKKGRFLVEGALGQGLPEHAIELNPKQDQQGMSYHDNFIIERKVYELFKDKKYYQKLIEKDFGSLKPRPQYELVNAGKDRQSFSGPCVHAIYDKFGKVQEAFILVERGGKELPMVARLNREQLKDIVEMKIGEKFSVKASLNGMEAKITSKSNIKSLLKGMGVNRG